jgi:hypothetical protein
MFCLFHCPYFFIILIVVRLSPPGTAATTGLLYQLQMINDGDCGAVGGMKIGRGNRSTWRKPAPAPLCPPQISHDQTQHQTREPVTNRLSYGTAISLSLADPLCICWKWMWHEVRDYFWRKLGRPLQHAEINFPCLTLRFSSSYLHTNQ